MTSIPDDTPLTRFARPVAVPVLTATGAPVFSGDCILTGWSFVETTGTGTAVVEIYDGNSAVGTLVACINLQASESTRDLMSKWGLEMRVGTFVNVVSGTVKGSLWVVDLS